MIECPRIEIPPDSLLPHFKVEKLKNLYPSHKFHLLLWYTVNVTTELKV